ncbi:MAG TPA: hypothetical protein VFS30_07255 [Dehalococcoidia bacterium]|nr:hypothetical protein [Dehalococcoidia bacterium]
MRVGELSRHRIIAPLHAAPRRVTAPGYLDPTDESRGGAAKR